jgi:hypothetical protein
MIVTIPTTKALNERWEAYSLLRQAEALDPALLGDGDFRAACDRAHKRWFAAFAKWDGK